MQNLSIFQYNQSVVRTFSDSNNELWFLANDICDILGYLNPRRTVDLHCKPKGVTKRYTPTQSGEQEMTYINEPNLYRLIIKSKKQEAEPFEEWVMEVVLPTIRKTGSYSNDTVGIEGYSELKELNKLIGNILEYRFVLTFDENKKPHIRILSYDDLIISIENLPKMINNKLTLSEELLLKIMQACTKRLTLMASCREIQTRLDKSS